MRAIWVLALGFGLAAAGCGSKNVVWAGSCTAVCPGGLAVTDAETVCASESESTANAASTLSSQCVTAVQGRTANCNNPTCTCTVVKGTTGC